MVDFYGINVGKYTGYGCYGLYYQPKLHALIFGKSFKKFPDKIVTFAVSDPPELGNSMAPVFVGRVYRFEVYRFENVVLLVEVGDPFWSSVLWSSKSGAIPSPLTASGLNLNFFNSPVTILPHPILSAEKKYVRLTGRN